VTREEAIEAIEALADHLPASVRLGDAPAWLRERAEGRRDGLKEALVIVRMIET